MFSLSLILAIIIGYLLKGKLHNLADLQIRYTWLILVGFVMERVLNLLLQNQIIELSGMTYTLDLLMYILILICIGLNRDKIELIVMGIGFILNALAIFTNGGAMPVSSEALAYMGIVDDLANKGLYGIMNEATQFKILGDIIPIQIGRLGFVISLGDIILCIGMMMLVIRGMRGNTKQLNK